LFVGCVHKVILSFPLQVQAYESAIVKGVKLSCRGRYFADAPGNDHHNLHLNWSVKRHYKSWFRFQNYYIERIFDSSKKRKSRVEVAREVRQTTMFGQMDFCFRLNIPGEPFIHGLAMGHCTTRDAIYSDKRWQHWVDPNANPSSCKTFVCLNYVDSTAIAVRLTILCDCIKKYFILFSVVCLL
jgi:hypothetical protein